MNIEALEEFLVLAETCSFQETAARLHLSQSSLSKHIRKLEEELGAALLDRSTRSVALSEYGRALAPHARRISEEKKAALAGLRQLADGSMETVTVSYVPVLGQYGLIETLSDFSRAHPELTLRTLESYGPVELLRSGGCDFAFEEGGGPESGLRRSVYRTDRLAAVLPADHPLAGREKVTLEELQGERFILHARQGGIPREETEKFLALCRERRFTPEIAAEAEYTSSMVRYVSAGRGVAVLNRMHIPAGMGDVAVVDLDPPVVSEFSLFYAKKLSSPAAKAFLRFITEKD